MREHVGQDGSAEGFGLAGVDVAFKQGVAVPEKLVFVLCSMISILSLLHLHLNYDVIAS
jgi:hypothetical protein